VSKLQEAVHSSTPPGASLWYKWGSQSNPGPGFLGAAHTPFEPIGGERKNMVLEGITLDRLNDRRRLMRSFDQLRTQRNTHTLLGGSAPFQEQAFDILTSGSLAQALDLSQEDPQVVARYG